MYLISTSDCCLTPREQFCSNIKTKTSYFQMIRCWCLLSTRPTHRAGYQYWNNPLIDMLHYQNSTQSLLLLFKTVCWTEKQLIQIYWLWYDQNVDWTYNFLHLRWELNPLHHRGGYEQILYFKHILLSHKTRQVVNLWNLLQYI